MAETISYEVYAFKGGKWVIDSVYDDKQQALHEARILLESRHLTGVKIIQENYDSEKDKTSAMIIFNETKNSEKVKRQPRKKKTSGTGSKGSTASTGKATRRKRNAKKDDFQKSIIKMVVILGGLALGGVALAAYYVTMFGQ